MMSGRVAGALLLCCLGAQAASSDLTPVTKVVTLLSDLEAKITAEGEAEAKAYKEFTKWCDESAANVGFQIKTATSEKAELEATIAKSSADAETSAAHISELAADISTAEAELSNATSIRKSENGEFLSTEAELMEAIDTLSRAIAILDKEMAKNPAFLQNTANAAGVQGLMQTLKVFIDSAALSSHDKKTLTALVQDHQSSEDADADDELGAPAAAIYKTHSSSILDTLEDLREKAEGELAELRKGETSASHNFNMLKQSLTDQVAALTKEMGETKADKASSEETLAQAKGDLDVTVKELAAAEATKATVETDCSTTAKDHEESVKSRAEELAALAKAKEIITSSTAGAVAQTYSFAQISASSGSNLRTRSDLAQVEIATMVKKLADKQHSTELAQLATRISAVLHYEAGVGEDPFAKVKGLISDMIAKLEAEATAEASHKAYCDDETAKTAAKKAELTSDVDTLSAKIDKAVAESAKLKGEVAELQTELAALLKLQGEMDKARADERAAFVQAKADLEQGLEGIQQAIRVLRDYYAADEESLLQQPEMPEYHSKALGKGNSIIEILEVIESDFSKNLAQETVAEDEAQAEYEKTTQANKITKTTKDQDVKYKTQEATGLDKAVAEYSSDRAGLQNELSAVLEYSEKLVAQCVAKPETYEERKRRRTAEIEGLKEALTYLEGEAAFLQKPAAKSNKRFMSIGSHQQ